MCLWLLDGSSHLGAVMEFNLQPRIADWLLCCACRLPKLNSMVLTIQQHQPTKYIYDVSSAALAMQLRSMGQQLTQLRGLIITSDHSTGWLRARAAWEQLASIRQLTSLNLNMWYAHVDVADLGVLGQLTQLSELGVRAMRVGRVLQH